MPETSAAMTSDQERDALWQAVLAAVSKLTEQQPGAYEYRETGSGWWAAPHGSMRSPASYSDDGRTVEATFTVWERDETEKTYSLTIRREGGA
jgi:hypothetical protein